MLDKFLQASVVQDWQWDLITQIRCGLEDAYGTQQGEVGCVQAIVQAIHNMQSVEVKLNKGMFLKLEVEAAFLHGSKSQVKFQVGKTEYQRELADLFVLGTYVHDGQPVFQRACLIQAKRQGRSTGRDAARYEVDLGQLAMLTSFPEFTGVSGVFKGFNKVHFRNCSGMLGAYCLLSPPGEFIIVSARVLTLVLGGRKSLSAKELVPAILSENAGSRNSLHYLEGCGWFDPDRCPDCHVLSMHGFPCHCRRHRQLSRATILGGLTEASVESVLTCIGLAEFVQCWTGLRLGEVCRVGANLGARSERILQTALQAVVRRVGGETENLIKRWVCSRTRVAMTTFESM
ncbi:MAG: hypothetical protein KGZ75_02435 [Syntrophomonadaceae bacterium]|jgi:hypothetical protein|nr:hypothetical protein [Syntrophomonadaceae bacterium]